MDFAISEVNRIVRSYQAQEKVAELIRETPVKTVQGQVDRVTLSAKARQLAQAAAKLETAGEPQDINTQDLQAMVDGLPAVSEPPPEEGLQ
ncbi:MAG: hypothetical protein HZA02_02135 [Nitrospinae bacterium]|nr:hypothetical protein [Nitrospinota bacterium]